MSLGEQNSAIAAEKSMINNITTRDARFPIGSGHGSDAIHRDPVYSYAATLLHDDSGLVGTGLAFTLGEGNDLVCRAAEFYAKQLIGRDIEEVMAGFGEFQRKLSDEQQFRWLGPHKGLVHLALASVTNACWDLWARKRGVPLWKLLLDLSADEILATLDFSYVTDALSLDEARKLIETPRATRHLREGILEAGYPGYDTSIGWFNYSDEQVASNVAKSAAEGFTAMKLKVGSPDLDRDIRRARLVRQAAGDSVRLMVDANQQWTIAQSITFSEATRDLNLFWLEEPTHPDDVLGHRAIAEATADPATPYAVGAITDARHWLGTPYWGLGYASESARALMDWARIISCPSGLPSSMAAWKRGHGHI